LRPWVFQAKRTEFEAQFSSLNIVFPSAIWFPVATSKYNNSYAPQVLLICLLSDDQSNAVINDECFLQVATYL